MTVDTKSAPRRPLAFSSLDQIVDDLAKIEAAVNEGTETTTGNWSVGEICEHCAIFLRFAIDGFPSRAPAPMRWVARFMFLKKAMGPEPLPPGFKLPKAAAALIPEPTVTDAEGIDSLRKELKRVLAGKEITNPSPLLGPLTHDQWIILQCKHCAMHMSFIAYPDN